MNWDDFRLVHAIAENRSLVGAAQALGINHSTIFRRLAQIEAAIGKPLFERSRAGYAPTEAGEEMIALASSMAQGVLDFERRIAGKDDRPRGLLRLTTTDSFFYCLVAPILGGFAQAYPDIDLEIVVSSAALSLSRRDADIAIRVSGEPEPTLVGRKIAPLGFGIYAHADKAADARPFEEGARFIDFGPPLDDIERRRWIAANAPAARIAARVNTMLMAAQAARAGLGFAVLPRIIGENTQGLVCVHALKETRASLWLLTHADLKNSARVRAFMDYAWPILVKKRAEITGRPDE